MYKNDIKMKCVYYILFIIKGTTATITTLQHNSYNE
jgi:hypothetical protein